MELKEIAKRNYDSAVRRGKITHKTTIRDQIYQILSEVDELIESTSIVHAKYPADIKELADIVISCFTLAEMKSWDLQKAIEEKTLYNEIRKD